MVIHVSLFLKRILIISLGFFIMKDLIPHINKKTYNWNKIIREPFFVPENKKT